MLKKMFFAIILIIVAVILIVVGYLFSIHSVRPTPAPKPISQLFDQSYVDESLEAINWMESLYSKHQLPSLSVAVAINGQITWQGVIGYSDLNRESVADLKTRYRIGSISKSMTAVSVMRLQEKGILKIDDTFGQYAPDYATDYHKITLKQLLSHQGGIRHYKDEVAENFSFTEYKTTREASAIVEQDPLLFEPGNGFHYSTYGYTLLSLAMESATHQPFEKIMQDEIFHPLDLQSTKFNRENQQDENVSLPYIEMDGSLYKSPEPNVSNKYAGGGFLSTPEDLVKFGNALLGDALISTETKNQLWQPVVLADGKMNPEHYALGFRSESDEIGRFVHHGGKSVGGYSFLLIYPESKIVIALASNVTPEGNSFDRLKEAKKLASIFK